jgi:ubiquinone/menaquinone biosynthesis C-methylase UbiE
MSTDASYPLGYSDSEARRLAAQAAYLEDQTADVLRRAGVAPFMRVLDLGCGVGDVSLLAASLVGSNGSVLGIDRDKYSI